MRLLITTMLLTACQPNDQEGTTRNFAQPRGTDICEELVAAYCVRCEVGDVWSYEECLERPEIDVDCDDTINVGAEHENCLEDIRAGQCGDMLPQSCNGVVIVPD